MNIDSLRVERTAKNAEKITAMVGGVAIDYAVIGSPTALRRSYDPFLVAGFALAMESGEEITLQGDAPVSSPLITNVGSAMDVYRQWLSRLHRVPIHGGLVEDAPEPGSDHVGCFFSGGVDSLYTFIENEAEITHLILCQGLDIPFDEVDRWKRTVDSALRFAEEHGKELVLIATNARHPMRPPGRTDNHGAVLVSTGLGLGFRKLLVPGSHSLLDLFPWGSHPLLDPLYSNGVTQVFHDSPVRRSTKTETIVRTGIGLDSLRVCNVFSQYNCGTCEKCLRTRTMLALLGARSPALAPLDDPTSLRSLKLHSDSQYSFWVDNLEYADRMGRQDFRREIGRVLQKFRVRRALRQLDADLLGGAIAGAKRALRSGKKR